MVTPHLWLSPSHGQEHSCQCLLPPLACSTSYSQFEQVHQEACVLHCQEASELIQPTAAGPSSCRVLPGGAEGERALPLATLKPRWKIECSPLLLLFPLPFGTATLCSHCHFSLFGLL